MVDVQQILHVCYTLYIYMTLNENNTWLYYSLHFVIGIIFRGSRHWFGDDHCKLLIDEACCVCKIFSRLGCDAENRSAYT